MIVNFKSDETKLVFNGFASRYYPPDIEKSALRKLLLLDAATSINDLRIPPGNRLEKLVGDRKGQHSIRINDQWRICFTPYRLGKDIGLAQTRISEILSEKRSITADTALRLSHYFGNSPQFWLNLQTQYDLRQAQEENKEIYSHIPVAQLAHLA